MRSVKRIRNAFFCKGWYSFQLQKDFFFAVYQQTLKGQTLNIKLLTWVQI